MIRTVFRGLYLVSSIFVFLFSACVLELGMALCRLRYSAKQSARTRHASLSARRLMKAFHFEIQLKDLERLSGLNSSALLVANHLSFWDALIISAAVDRVTFITSVEVRDTPIIGWIGRAVGFLMGKTQIAHNYNIFFMNIYNPLKILF